MLTKKAYPRSKVNISFTNKSGLSSLNALTSDSTPGGVTSSKDAGFIATGGIQESSKAKQKKKKTRTTFTAFQLEELEKAFERAPYPGKVKSCLNLFHCGFTFFARFHMASNFLKGFLCFAIR